MKKRKTFLKKILVLITVAAVLSGCTVDSALNESLLASTLSSSSASTVYDIVKNNIENGSGNNPGSSFTSTETLTTSTSVSGEITLYNSSEQIDLYSWSNSYVPNVSSRSIATDAPDVDSVNFESIVYVNLSAMKISEDNSVWTELSQTETEIFSGTVKAKLEDSVISIDTSSAGAVAFDITGNTSKGAILLSTNKKKAARICLHDAVIASSGNYPCLSVDSKSTVYLVLEGTNSFTDGRSYGIGYSAAEGTDYYTSSYSGDTSGLELTASWAKGADTKASVYTKGPLIVSGSGSLEVTEGYKHGIYSKDYIKVLSGALTVKSTGRNGIQSVNGFVMNGGSIVIKGTGTHTNNESRGIIVEGSEDYPGEGYIVINGGTIDSTTVSKGISAKWDIDEDYAEYGTGTNDVSNDPYPYVLITGGKITVKTTGTPMDESKQKYSIVDANGVTVSETTKLSPEGIEGKQAVFISGGVITVNSTDDGINASCDKSGVAGQIVINGGNIHVYSSGNDGIDSNGNLTINGGIITSFTGTNPECAFDCDQNTFAITGGLVCGIGTNNYSTPTASACKQSTVVFSGNYFGGGGTVFAVKDAEENAVFAVQVPSGYSTSENSSLIMIFSSPEIKTGTTYSAVKGVSVSGGTMFNNLYVELPAISGGTVSDSGVTTSTANYVYTMTSGGNGGPQEGTHQNGGPGNPGQQGPGPGNW